MLQNHNDTRTWTLSALLAICVENPMMTSGFQYKGPVMQGFDFFLLTWISCWINIQITGALTLIVSCINSSPPSVTYMRQWIGSELVQIWLVDYSAPSHHLKQYWLIVNWTLRNKLQWNFNQNIKLFVHENASENIVCEMAAILSRGHFKSVCFRNGIPL